MSSSFLWWIFPAFFVITALFVMAGAAFVFYRVFVTFRQVDRVQSEALKSMGSSEGRVPPDAQPITGDVLRCKQCGAVVDSTAELSPEGRIRCNYCNTWTSLYSQGSSTQDS